MGVETAASIPSCSTPAALTPDALIDFCLLLGHLFLFLVQLVASVICVTELAHGGRTDKSIDVISELTFPFFVVCLFASFCDAFVLALS